MINPQEQFHATINSKRRDGETLVFYGLFTLWVTVIVMGIFRGDFSFLGYQNLEKSKILLQETTKNLEKENQTLRLEISKLKSSPGYAKKVLRDKYHVTEDNEHIVFFGNL
jgi:cell division protein FtsB